MNRRTWLVVIALAAFAAFAATPVAASAGRTGFGFNAAEIKGFPTGAVALSGGGSIDASVGTGHGSGGFSCLEDVNQGPLNGCRSGEGVRWDTASVLRSTSFKCTGAASEALKTASTSATTVVLRADFYRAGDANDESFTAQIIVSAGDLDPVLPGIQTVWVQGVGCGSSVGGFNVGRSAA